LIISEQTHAITGSILIRRGLIGDREQMTVNSFDFSDWYTRNFRALFSAA